MTNQAHQVKSFLTSPDWLEFQKSLGRTVWQYDQVGVSAGIIELDTWLSQHYLYIPHGPRVEGEASLDALMGYVRQIGQQRRSLMLIAEPLSDAVAQQLVKQGSKPTSKSLQPAKTVILDLTQSVEQLQQQMHHKTRYNIRVAEKSGIVVKENQDIEAFWALLEKTTQHDQFSAHPRDYYEQLFKFFQTTHELSIKLFLAYYQETPVAGALVLYYQDVAYYLHGASDYTYRSYMAPYLLHWQIMTSLMESDYSSYDLWGINAQRYPGVTRFKLGWGGRVVERPGAFELPFPGAMYYLYKFLRSVREVREARGRILLNIVNRFKNHGNV